MDRINLTHEEEKRTAWIAVNKHTPAFDMITAHTAKQAIYKIKRKYKEWRDCTIWVKSEDHYNDTIHDGGL